MYMKAMTENKIVINNPSIWRPILGINDTVTAYLRAIQADQTISGIFNLDSGNYTVGDVGDKVWSYFKKRYNKKIDLEIKDIQDFRNYKVTTQKVKDVLGVTFHESVESI